MLFYPTRLGNIMVGIVGKGRKNKVKVADQNIFLYVWQ